MGSFSELRKGFMSFDLQIIDRTEISVSLDYKNSFTNQGLEASSQKRYIPDWEDFSLWCAKNRRQIMPAHPHDVADYLEDRALNSWVGFSGKKKELKEKQPLKWNTLTGRLTAIAKIHEYHGHSFNRNDLAIKKTLTGIKKTLCKEQPHRIIETRKSPLLMDDIKKMVRSLPETLTGKRDKALLLIGFVGALRRSEIINIQKEHLSFLKEGLVIMLPWSKTGMREVNIPYASNPEICPLRSLQDWISCAKIESGAIFKAINRHGQIQDKALSCKSVTLIINRNSHIVEIITDAKKRKDLDSTVFLPDFGGHSLRAGFVTQAILNDAPEHTIMDQTGHKKSDTLKKYIREVNKWKNSAALKLGL